MDFGLAHLSALGESSNWNELSKSKEGGDLRTLSVRLQHKNLLPVRVLENVHNYVERIAHFHYGVYVQLSEGTIYVSLEVVFDIVPMEEFVLIILWNENTVGEMVRS